MTQTHLRAARQNRIPFVSGETLCAFGRPAARPRLRRFVPLVALLGLVGCAREARITLLQPAAPPSQRNLRLETEAAFQRAADGRVTCVCAFPLPGAAAGPRAFVLYLDTPEEFGSLPVAAGDATAARGFIIQEIGSLAGQTRFTGGSIRAQRVWMAPRLRDLQLDLSCEDGTRITGRVRAEAVPTEVHTFEREFAADIAQLDPTDSATASDSSSAPATTSTRATPER